MRTSLLFGAVLSLVVLVGMQIVSLHRTNTRLRAEVNEKRASSENRIVKTDRSTTVIAARADGGGESTGLNGDAAPSPHMEASKAHARLKQLRAEAAAWEKNALEQYAANSEATDAPSTNRDPERGMTKLEYMRNVGQGTPAAALQTFFWATLKGDDQVIARIVAWDETVRPKVQVLIDRLPEESKARYATPEKLWGLIISKYALDVSAIHIAETVLKDTANASLTVKGLTARDEHLGMHLGPNGWQLLVGERHLEMLNDELTGKKGN